jgi:hypothetical protein
MQNLEHSSGNYIAYLPKEKFMIEGCIYNPDYADGKWYVSEQADGPMTDWREREFTPRELTRLTFDINAVVETGPAYNVDLSKVDEIGYTDLMTGGDVADAPSGAAASRVDWIEVWGFPVSRSDSNEAIEYWEEHDPNTFVDAFHDHYRGNRVGKNQSTGADHFRYRRPGCCLWKCEEHVRTYEYNPGFLRVERRTRTYRNVRCRKRRRVGRDYGEVARVANARQR